MVYADSYLALNLVAPNNAPTVSHCLGAAASAKGVSIGLDILGAIPVFGNGVSAGAGIVRAGIAVNHAITSLVFAVGSGIYGAYGGVTAGPEEATDSLIGSGSAGAGIGLALADVALGRTKAIPIVGKCCLWPYWAIRRLSGLSDVSSLHGRPLMGAGMFDDEVSKEKSSTGWTGPIIVAMLAPVFFLFVYLGKAEMGFTACLILGMFMVAVRLRWKLRRYGWFWATVVFVLLLHIPFLFWFTGRRPMFPPSSIRCHLGSWIFC